MWRNLLVVVMLLACSVAPATGAPTAAAQTLNFKLERKERGGWFAWPAKQLEYRIDRPYLNAEGTFHYAWVEVVGLPNMFITARINARLRKLGGAERVALPRTGMPVQEGDTPLDDTIECRVALVAPDVVSVLFMRQSHATIESPKFDVVNTVCHFDLRSGEELTLNDFVQPGALRVIAAALPASEEFAIDENILSDFKGMSGTTQVFFNAGNLVVRVKDEGRGNYELCTVPVAKIREVLSPRGRAMAEASMNQPKIAF